MLPKVNDFHSFGLISDSNSGVLICVHLQKPTSVALQRAGLCLGATVVACVHGKAGGKMQRMSKQHLQGGLGSDGSSIRGRSRKPLEAGWCSEGGPGRGMRRLIFLPITEREKQGLTMMVRRQVCAGRHKCPLSGLDSVQRARCPQKSRSPCALGARQGGNPGVGEVIPAAGGSWAEMPAAGTQAAPNLHQGGGLNTPGAQEDSSPNFI